MSNLNSRSRKFDAKSTQSLIASRAIVMLKDAQNGETRRFHIVGNGTVVPVLTKDKQPVLDQQTNAPLHKTIYNVKANSQLAMSNPRNQQILRDAMKAEAEGDVDAADELFNQYLNKIQVSFSVIINSGRTTVSFYDKQLVEGELEVITTENGQLVTVTNVRAVVAAKLAATPAFSLADLMGLDEKKPEPKADDIFNDDTKVGEGAAEKAEQAD